MSASRRRPALDLAVQIAARAAGIPSARSFRRWVTAALAHPASIGLRVVAVPEGRALNSAFRGKDYATNVLSFDYGTDATGSLQGDIVLCAPVIAAQARAQGKRLAAHYAHLTVHGVLHLQGYDHARRRDAMKMEALEIKLLAKLGYADPYASD